jgi:LAO/AO transport system kinase
VVFDRLRLSKALSKIAAAGVAESLLAPVEESGRHARVIGITGSPGAGKSTLISRIALKRLPRHDSSLAILAIDPTSPRSEGSLLGDRIRMEALSDDPRVFIRSLPRSSAEDGLTENIAEVLLALSQGGFDEVLIETVGAGQTAYGVRTFADVEVLVLTPGAGDYVQAMKAGIIETADIYVVNKSDLPGADRVVIELMNALQRAPTDPQPVVIQVKVGDDAGILRLSAALDLCLEAAQHPHVRAAGERARRLYRIRALIQRRLREVMSAMPDDVWNLPVPEVYQRLILALSRSD